jgi:hypothetical protein
MDGQCGLRHCWLHKVGFGKLPAAFSLTAAAAAVRGQWRQFRHHHRRGHKPRASRSATGGASSLLEASKRWHCAGSTTSIPGCSHRQPGWRRPGAGWARNGESAANVLSCHRRLCAAHLRPLRHHPLRIPPLLRLLAASSLHRSRCARWLRVFGGRRGGSGRWRSVCPSEWWRHAGGDWHAVLRASAASTRVALERPEMSASAGANLEA